VPPVATHEHEHRHIIRRPFLVGVVHGLAGSAALMLAVLGTIGSPWTGMLYVLVFGGGTMVGMLAISALIGLPLVLTSRRLGAAANHLQLAIGLGAVAFGLSYTWHTALVAGLRPHVLP
jgi:sulfite exporter TauE/SafE